MYTVYDICSTACVLHTVVTQVIEESTEQLDFDLLCKPAYS